MFVLPVDTGVTSLSSEWSDGLEELRLLDVPNRFNMTLIAPSFNYEPWYGDNATDPSHRMESFIIDDLVPFADTFGDDGVPQRYLIGFSKSGNGALTLILRHPEIFNAAAAWDAPTQLSDLSRFPALALNFGTQANFDLYHIPTLVANHASAFQQQNRLWISGDEAAWTEDMIDLDSQLTAAFIPHSWVEAGIRAHSWNSGWLEGAVSTLDANAAVTTPAGGKALAAQGSGQNGGPPVVHTTRTRIRWTRRRRAMLRYGVAFLGLLLVVAAIAVFLKRNRRGWFA